jgi:hypothetical protein
VVLTTGCDKTTPAQIMAAATVDLPAIVLSGGPMLNGWYTGTRTGSRTIAWQAREMLARGGNRQAGRYRADRLVGPLRQLLQYDGHRNHYELARRSARHEPFGLRGHSRTLPGARIAYMTGKRI